MVIDLFKKQYSWCRWRVCAGERNDPVHEVVYRVSGAKGQDTPTCWASQGYLWVVINLRCHMYGYTYSIYALAMLLLFVVSKMEGHNFLWSYDFLKWGYLLMCALGSNIGGIELLRVLTAWYEAEDKTKPIKESGPQSLSQTCAPKLVSIALASGGLRMPI